MYHNNDIASHYSSYSGSGSDVQETSMGSFTNLAVGSEAQISSF